MGDEGANAYAPSMTSQYESQTSRQSSRETLGSSSTTSGFVKRRKKKPNFSQLQTIQIDRAPNGFGFLLAGNAPCYLSEVISGTPAESAGLLPGQYIMTINGENASTWRVDKVVEYIMNSGDRLLLNVAIDDEEPAQEPEEQTGTRSKPPVKPSTLQRSRNIKYGPGNTPRSVPSSWSNIANIELPVNERLSSKVFGSYVSSDALGSCASDPSNRGSSLSSSNEQYPTPMTSANSELKEQSGSNSSLDCQRASSCSSASTAKSSQAESANLAPQRMSVSGKVSSDSEWLISQTSSKSSLRHLNNSSDIFSAAVSGNFYSFVGYVRSIDIPSQTRDQISTMTALLNSVKRHDRKINFVLLLEVSDSGLRLINAKKSTVTSVNFTSVLSCIPLGEDKQFFGVLARRPTGAEGANSPVTCMVLAIDPQIAHHEVHVKAAKKFTLACTRVTSTLCKEFPDDCGAIIAKIQSKLPNPPGSAFDAICSRSSSSNSDSGIATCKDRLGKVGFGPMHTARGPHHALAHREANIPAVTSNVNHWFENRNPRPLSELNPPIFNDPNPIEATPSQHADAHYAQRRSEHRPSSVYQPAMGSQPGNGPFSQNFSGPSSLPMNPPTASIKSPTLGTLERIRPMSGLNQINSWAANFDNLLNDPKGVAIFTEFLKKEFAEENIIFYQLCQDFKALFDYHEMKELAMKIYHQHLASNCPHPVNLDSQVLQSVYEKLESNLISRDIFDEAVLQIYKLMKFDPYSRFLKSELYSDCVKNSVCSPNGDPSLKDEKRGNFSLGSSDAASDESNCQTESRKGPFLKKSFLPWKKKSKPRNDSTDSSVKSLEKTRGLSQSSDSLLVSIPSHSSIEASTHCKVYLPNGCHVVEECDQSKTVGDTVVTLCMEYNLNTRCLDVVDSEHRTIAFGEILKRFAGREIYLERRVYFKLQLPSSQNVGVKSKPNISIKDVFQPLLVKYRLSLNNLIIRLADSTTPLNLQLAVAVLDSKRVIADTIEQYNELTLGKENAQTQSVPILQVKQEPQISSSLVTRRPRHKLPEPIKQEFKSSILPRPSNEEHQIGSSRHETDAVSHRYETSNTTSNQTDLNFEQGQFIGLLAKVQGDRLDNQRGIMSLSKLEMPTFLEPNDEPVQSHSTPEKWHDCCYSASCVHLNSEARDQWQSTMIHPYVTKNRHQDGRPPTGRHRKIVYPANGNTGRHPPNHSSGPHYTSISNSKNLSREITPIPGSSDQYYNTSPDVSSVDIYPSELPSPSTFGVYPLTAPPSPSNVAPPLEADFSGGFPSYEQTPVGPGRVSPRKANAATPTMLKSSSTEWYHHPNPSLIGSFDGNQRSSLGSQSQSRTHGSTMSSPSKPDSNLHYPSAASSQSMTSVNNDIGAYFHEQPDEIPEEIGNVQVYHV